MKESEAINLLKSLGVAVEHRKRHYYLTYKEKWTTMTRHPSKDFKKENLKNILRQLQISYKL